MKKQIIITFDIYQDKLDNQNPDFTIYSEYLPNNPNKFGLEELEKTGFKKMIKMSGERKEIPDRFGRRYTYRIKKEDLDKLFKEN